MLIKLQNAIARTFLSIVRADAPLQILAAESTLPHVSVHFSLVRDEYSQQSSRKDYGAHHLKGFIDEKLSGLVAE